MRARKTEAVTRFRSRLHNRQDVGALRAAPGFQDVTGVRVAKSSDGRERRPTGKDSRDGKGPRRAEAEARGSARSRVHTCAKQTSCSSQPSYQGRGSSSTRATCAGSCPSRVSGGAATCAKTLVRSMTHKRESPERQRVHPDKLGSAASRFIHK